MGCNCKLYLRLVVFFYLCQLIALPFFRVYVCQCSLCINRSLSIVYFKHSVMTHSTTTFSIMKFSLMTFGIISFFKMTLSMTVLLCRVSYIVSVTNKPFILNVIMVNVLYAECCGALYTSVFLVELQIQKSFQTIFIHP